MQRTLWATVLAFLLIPSRADACSCVGGIPLCESFWKTPAVLAGEVLEITAVPSANEPQLAVSRVVRFRVTQAFRGDVTGVVDIHTGSGGGDCGYHFVKGSRYLVYGHFQDGFVWTSICSRTRLLSNAAEDLEYFKTALASVVAGRIFGTAAVRGTSPRDPRRPAAGYTIVAADVSDGKEWKTTTSGDGRYEFKSIPPGKYIVRIILPAGEFVFENPIQYFADSRGCAGTNFDIAAIGRVAVVQDPGPHWTRILNIEGR